MKTETNTVIPGAETVAALILGREFPERFRLGYRCHNPVIIVDQSGVRIDPDSSLVPNDGIEAEIDSIGSLDADGGICQLAGRVGNIPDEFWDRHPKLTGRISDWLGEQIGRAAENCAIYVSNCFEENYREARQDA